MKIKSFSFSSLKPAQTGTKTKSNVPNPRTNEVVYHSPTSPCSISMLAVIPTNGRLNVLKKRLLKILSEDELEATLKKNVGRSSF